MASAETDIKDIDAIAISRGPGSFTGLRIGSATAKGLGLAIDKPLVEVPTLRAMAYGIFGTGDELICPIMDARRSEVYSAVFAAGLETVLEESAGPVTELIDRLNGLGRKVIFLGDGVPVYREIIEEQIRTEYAFAPEIMSKQRAATVAALGLEELKAGGGISADEHVPVYLRVSQAEREKFGGRSNEPGQKNEA